MSDNKSTMSDEVSVINYDHFYKIQDPPNKDKNVFVSKYMQCRFDFLGKTIGTYIWNNTGLPTSWFTHTPNPYVCIKKTALVRADGKIISDVSSVEHPCIFTFRGEIVNDHLKGISTEGYKY